MTQAYSPNYTPDNVETFFKYHPPLTELRKMQHEVVNSACLKCAQVILNTVGDPRFSQLAINYLQQARMFANQGITTAELLQQGAFEDRPAIEPVDVSKVNSINGIETADFVDNMNDFPLGVACDAAGLGETCEGCQ